VIAVTRSPLSAVDHGGVEAFTRDSFFASPGFASLWVHRGGRPVVWSAEVGGILAAVLPGVEFGRGPLARFASMPDGCYGGVFTNADLDGARDRVCTALMEAVARRRYAKSFIFDFYAATPSHRCFCDHHHEAYVADLGGSAWRPPDPKLRSQIRHAEREGLRVVPLDWDRHGGRFWDLVVGTSRRHGERPRYPRAFFRDLAALGRRDSRVRWMWCEHEGRGVCSHIYFLDRGVLQCWQSYWDKRFASLKANQYTRYCVCRKAAADGVRRLNLGEVPAGAHGLRRYKERWGARPVGYDSHDRRQHIGKVL
jgi:hypothetical protein